MKVREIGEQALLKRLFRFCASEVVGDDGAILDLQPGYQLAIATDVLVDEVHFSDRTTPPHAVGWRSAAANLSDLAAMGASPLGITVGLSLTGETPISWVEDLYQGMTDCLQIHQTPIVGGDVVRSPVNSVSITAVGEVQPHRIIQRHTGQPGDLILVTGVHGASRAGLECLLNPEWGKELSLGDRQKLIESHQYPQPRLDLLPLLSNINPSRMTGIDSSDGLADALQQICHASQVGAQIHNFEIPYPQILDPILSEEQRYHWVFYGGEDFELVLCLPPQAAYLLLSQLETGAIIGELIPGDRIEILGRSKQNPNRILDRRWGFQHFS